TDHLMYICDGLFYASGFRLRARRPSCKTEPDLAQRKRAVMILHPRAIGAAALILAAAWLAQLMVPRELMPRASETFDLQTIIPGQFGEWTQVPGIRLVEPTEPDALAHQLYSQEMGRGYVDHEGHLVMLMVAYGPSQSDRLQLHRPEACYVAEGFRV